MRRFTNISAYFVAPVIALSLACGEPAGAEHTVAGGLGPKKSSKITPFKPSKSTSTVTISKATKAALLARAKDAGWASADVKALKNAIGDIESLTPAQMKRVRCRIGEVFQARKPLILTTLREAGATSSELKAASRAVDDLGAAICTGKAIKTHQRALGKIFVDVNERLTAGTALAGHNVTLDAFEDLMREMAGRCHQSTDLTSYGDLARLSDAEFDARLDKLAFGSCGQRSTGAGGISGLPHLPAGSDGNEYAQCVREAFREGVTSTADCQDIASGDGDGDGPDEPEGGDGADSGNSNPAMDAHDEASNTLGGIEAATGAALVVAGGVTILVGATTAEFGVGVAILAVGFALMAAGLEQMDEASGSYIERNGRRPSWSLWQCPTMSTPVGSFAFANPSGGGKGGAQSPMTVMDTMRACRCEHNPLDDFLSSGALGAFGGPSCELGDRLDCLRQSGNDVATPPNPECRALLRSDNQLSLAARLQECGVINCGDGLVGEDCSCWAGGGGTGGASQDPCAMVRCPEGAQPVPTGMRCTCESTTPGGPGIDCLPGTPGCGGSNSPNIPGGLPGGLPGGGGVPVPVPIPTPLPKPLPKPMAK